MFSTHKNDHFQLWYFVEKIRLYQSLTFLRKKNDCILLFVAQIEVKLDTVVNKTFQSANEMSLQNTSTVPLSKPTIICFKSLVEEIVSNESNMHILDSRTPVHSQIR